MHMFSCDNSNKNNNIISRVKLKFIMFPGINMELRKISVNGLKHEP